MGLKRLNINCLVLDKEYKFAIMILPNLVSYKALAFYACLQNCMYIRSGIKCQLQCKVILTCLNYHIKRYIYLLRIEDFIHMSIRLLGELKYAVLI